MGRSTEQPPYNRLATELSITKLPGSLLNDAYKSLYENKLWLQGSKCLQRKSSFPDMFSYSSPPMKSPTLVTMWSALVPKTQSCACLHLLQHTCIGHDGGVFTDCVLILNPGPQGRAS